MLFSLPVFLQWSDCLWQALVVGTEQIVWREEKELRNDEILSCSFIMLSAAGRDLPRCCWWHWSTSWTTLPSEFLYYILIFLLCLIVLWKLYTWYITIGKGIEIKKHMKAHKKILKTYPRHDVLKYIFILVCTPCLNKNQAKLFLL